MGTIASLAVGLSLNPTDYLTGLDRAGRKMEAFSRDVTRFALLPASALSKLSNMPVRAVDGFLGVVKNLLSSIPLVGGVLGAIPGTLAEVQSAFRSTVSEMAEMVRTSQKVGVSISTMSGLTMGGLVSQEEMQAGLFHLNRELGKVQMGDKGASDMFAKFGFDPQQLAKQGTEGALRTIADRMADLRSKTEKSIMSFELLGRTAVGFGEKLSHGSAAIDESAKMAKMLGTAFSEVDGRNILEANRAFNMIGATMTGLGRQIAVQLSPFIAAAGKAFMDWAMTGKSVGEIVSDALELITMGIAAVMDSWNILKGVFTKGSAAIDDALASILETIAETLDGLAKLGVGSGALKKMAADVHFYAEASKQAARELNKDADSQFKKPSNLFAVSKFFDDIRDRAKNASNAIGDLNIQTQSLAQAGKRFDAIEKAQQLTKDLATPLEQFQSHLAELRFAVLQGGLAWNVYERGVAKAVNELEKLEMAEHAKGPEALTAGSAAALSAINQANRTGDGDIQKRIKDVLDKTHQEMIRQTRNQELQIKMWSDLGVANLPA
jgi:hypothetical protein